MTLDPTLRPLLGTFLAEAESIAATISENLLRAERTDSAEELAVIRDEVGRGLHTLKGTAGTFGLEDLSSLAHALEDLIPTIIRPETNRASSVDQLLSGVDEFVSRLRAYADGREPETRPIKADDQPAPAGPGLGTYRVSGEEITQLLHEVDRLRELRLRLEERRSELDTLLPEVARSLGQVASEPLFGLRRGMVADVTAASDVLEGLEERTQRMCTLPTRAVLDPLQRAVRDICRKSGKRAALSVVGGETALDRRMLEALRGPLVQLVENALDHGIELPAERARAGKPKEGSIRVQIESSGDLVRIEVSDDGRGIALDRVREEAHRRGFGEPDALALYSAQALGEIVFRPGFSTSTEVTESSGRGMGLDIVRTEIKKLRGHIEFETREGRGTTFVITVPSRFGSSIVLGIQCCDQRFAVPVHAVEAVVMARREQLTITGERTLLSYENESLRLEDLGALLRLRHVRPAASGDPVMIVAAHGSRVALAVDELGRDMETVIHPLPEGVAEIDAYQGASSTATGELMLVLRPEWLIRQRSEIAARGPTVLVVDDSLTARALHRNMLEAGGFVVHTAASGHQALGMLERLRYDAIVCDIHMPNMDGVSFTAELRERPATRALPVVVVSAHADADTFELAKSAGADAVLSKNECVAGRLVRELKSALSRRRSS